MSDEVGGRKRELAMTRVISGWSCTFRVTLAVDSQSLTTHITPLLLYFTYQPFNVFGSAEIEIYT